MPRSAIRMIELQIANISAQNAIIDAIMQEIEELMNNCPGLSDKVRRLMQVPGINEQSAISLICEIGTVTRFSNVKKYLQYVGCAPTIYQSGTIRKPSHLNKRVNHFTKRTLLSAGRSVCSKVKKDSDLKEFARKQLNRHWNNKKLAHANTGIKIARIIYRLLLTGENYYPFHETQNGNGSKQEKNAKLGESQLRLTVVRKRTRRYLNYLQSILELQHEDIVKKVYDEIKMMWEPVVKS